MAELQIHCSSPNGSHKCDNSSPSFHDPVIPSNSVDCSLLFCHQRTPQAEGTHNFFPLHLIINTIMDRKIDWTPVAPSYNMRETMRNKTAKTEAGPSRGRTQTRNGQQTAPNYNKTLPDTPEIEITASAAASAAARGRSDTPTTPNKRSSSRMRGILDLFTPSEDKSEHRPSTPTRKNSGMGSTLKEFFGSRPTSTSSRSSSASRSNSNSRPSSSLSLRGFKDAFAERKAKRDAEREAERHERERQHQLDLAARERADQERYAETRRIQVQILQRRMAEQAAWDEQMTADREYERRKAEDEELEREAEIARTERDAALRQLEGVRAGALSTQTSQTTQMSDLVAPRTSRFVEADDIRVTDKPGEYPSNPVVSESKKGKKPARTSADNYEPPVIRPFVAQGLKTVAGKLGSTFRRPESHESDLSFADAGMASMMEACVKCGHVPQGTECLHFGKCKNCK